MVRAMGLDDLVRQQIECDMKAESRAIGSGRQIEVVGSMSRRGHRQTNNWTLHQHNGRLLQPKIVVAPNQRDIAARLLTFGYFASCWSHCRATVFPF